MPVDTDDVGAQDGRTTMATAWSLCTRTRVTADVLALLRDGFGRWRAGTGYDPAVARRFLEQLLAELMGDDLAPEEPPSSTPNAVVDPIAVHVAAMSWVVSELLALGVEPVMERLLYGFITLAPLVHVPSGSITWAFDYAARHDLPAPWG